MNNRHIKDELDTIARRSVPEDINLWPNISARLERKSKMLTPRTRPFVTILVTLLILLVLSGVAYALGKTLGYIPGVGLVENSSGIRMLAEPVLVTREGVTLTVTQVLVYADHVQLIYEVSGIAPENDSSTFSFEELNKSDQAAFCGGTTTPPFTDNDARLHLPDGTFINRAFGTDKYPENVFAMKPAFEAAIPADVTELKMLLRCIPWARLGSVPENWEIPLKLKYVPAGTMIGEPVVDVNATSEPFVTEPAASKAAPSSPQVTFTLEHVAQTDAGPIFYIRMHVANPDPALVVAIPRDVYVIDSQGQKIQYMGNTPSSENLPTTVYEYIPTAKPADGELTLVVADAVMKYAPLKDATFTFSAGENPQYDQTWILNKEFDIAGFKVNVESVRAATFDDIKDNPEIWNPNGGPDYPEGSQGFDNGYQFTVNIDSTQKMLGVQLDIQSDSCGMSEVRPLSPSPMIYYTNLCRNGYPKGNVNVILRGISVLVENVGQVVWSPDGMTVPQTATSNVPAPVVRMTLEKIVTLETKTVFYFSMDMENKDPSLISIMPVNVYVIDSLGQKLPLVGGFAWQPFEHRAGSSFEYTSQTKPAPGPLTLIVENVVAYYAPLHTEPPQATPDEMSFSFDAGENPQPNQTWILDNEFTIAGYKLKVTSARVTNYEDVKSRFPDFNDYSQGYEYGYDFAVEADPSVKLQVEMDIMSESPQCYLANTTSLVPQNSSFHYVQLCRETYPKGDVKVTIWELSVLMENAWQVVWTP